MDQPSVARQLPWRNIAGVLYTLLTKEILLMNTRYPIQYEQTYQTNTSSKFPFNLWTQNVEKHPLPQSTLPPQQMQGRPKRSRFSKRMILIAVAVVLVIVIAGTTAGVLVNRSNKTEEAGSGDYFGGNSGPGYPCSPCGEREQCDWTTRECVACGYSGQPVC